MEVVKRAQRANLQIRIILIGEGHLSGLSHLLLVLLEKGLVDGSSWRCERGSSNKFLEQVLVVGT
jgi:hypothetical protein